MNPEDPIEGAVDTEHFWYVYAVTRAVSRTPSGVLSGVDGGPVLTVPEGGLAAVVSPVSPADFAEEPLRARLEDIRWLERTARSHQRVVDGLTTGTRCVLPLRLATVCRDTDGVRRLLAAHQSRFTATLERLDGRVEWGVTVRTAPAAAAEPAAAASGRDYLRRRAGARRAEEDAWRRAEEEARAVHEALSGVAERSRLHAPQDAGLSGEPGHNVLNGAYLVPREREQEFCALVGRLAGRLTGPRLNLTGPWAPYSFTAEPAEPTASTEPAGAGAERAA